MSSQPFRSAISQFIDRRYIEEEVFSGAGTPVLSPVYEESLVPMNMRWDPSTRDDFIGEPGEGVVGEDAAKAVFREAGFQYSADGELLGR